MRVVYFLVYFVLPFVPVPVVALVPRAWPLMALLGVAIVAAYVAWLALTGFDATHEPIFLFDPGFLLIWFLATSVGFVPGQRRRRN